MQLFIDSYGAYLSVKDGMFCVKPKHSEAHLLPVRQVNAIFLTQGVALSTNAILLAIEHQIPVVLIDGIDRPKGVIWTQAYGSIATIRKKQALFTQHPQGFEWLKQNLLQKMAAQQNIGSFPFVVELLCLD